MNDTYECDGCGACCRTKLVDVFEEDLLREPRLGERMQPLREPGLDGEIGYLNCLSDGACPFLNGENRCGIYPTRPVVCVLFPAGSEECQEARQAFGHPPLEPIINSQP
jgi:Fe-S-cluster containining protein